ncbi:2-amino-4-hydroxy-6-hydroxymethyldihydropteridine diphosphokinase [Parerythrobacter lacustris]|uniref:2-amino-4-hydroxy-6-hydroxymethyldihydropteridine pyrophosphokinase n=1 Tax=Parerythrobacter lacustris TaxID=2969984 RepID=A0ABT1XXQ1_9SPHN|nr:2-amino-4-hydroxy-6-hydroxymethyldihydropteridine diphosphokinase [Parerythrobacter lacustris]MCR2835232.1 2-amino-4-hydroxy-6-hydroxymethyldihydropteridine diphosphokinase [Parerythrobacter lacustris]
MRQARYLLALGSNMRHAALGSPREVVATAIAALAEIGPVTARSRIIESAPLGPSLRRYANAAALVESELEPAHMLALLKRIERRFGRRRGQRWSARVLDLDIVLWSGGAWSSPELSVPHREFRRRSFVLGPAAQIAGDWRDPLSGLSLRQLNARLTKPSPLPR